jgi:hypothetical protein
LEPPDEATKVNLRQFTKAAGRPSKAKATKELALRLAEQKAWG